MDPEFDDCQLVVGLLTVLILVQMLYWAYICSRSLHSSCDPAYSGFGSDHHRPRSGSGSSVGDVSGRRVLCLDDNDDSDGHDD